MQEEREKLKPGRKSEYRDHFVEMAFWMSKCGLTDDQMAEEFGVHRTTFYDWKNEHPEFKESIQKGKDDIDSRVEMCGLLKNALGFEYQETTIEDTPKGLITKTYNRYKAPDTSAAIKWLQVRQRDRYADTSKISLELPTNIKIEVEPTTHNE